MFNATTSRASMRDGQGVFRTDSFDAALGWAADTIHPRLESVAIRSLYSMKVGDARNEKTAEVGQSL
jgi:hypothetical protein